MWGSLAPSWSLPSKVRVGRGNVRGTVSICWGVQVGVGWGANSSKG